jgi:hypothetical protein
MVALPFATAVTSPVGVTVATALFAERQVADAVTSWFELLL